MTTNVATLMKKNKTLLTKYIVKNILMIYLDLMVPLLLDKITIFMVKHAPSEVKNPSAKRF